MPDGEGGFDEALLESENGGKVVVAIKHEKKTFKKEQIQQVFFYTNLKVPKCEIFNPSDFHDLYIHHKAFPGDGDFVAKI